MVWTKCSKRGKIKFENTNAFAIAKVFKNICIVEMEEEMGSITLYKDVGMQRIGEI